MERELLAEQIDALRVEALEARRLAESLGDMQSIVDLENYAAQLEAEAEKLRLRNRSNAEDVAPTNHGTGRTLSTNNVR
jgi:hypothetical protein